MAQGLELLIDYYYYVRRCYISSGSQAYTTKQPDPVNSKPT